MLQNLLRERFKLAFHYGTKEMSGYELTLAPKGRPSGNHAARKPPRAAGGTPISSGQDKDGYRRLTRE